MTYTAHASPTHKKTKPYKNIIKIPKKKKEKKRRKETTPGLPKSKKIIKGPGIL
jgi:hypothetical protein